MNNTTDTSTTLTYEVFVNEAPRQDNGLLPNGEPKLFSPLASTLIYGARDAVLTDPGMTVDQARILGDWTLAKGRNLTDIFITHGHGDHWFAASVLAKRLGARVVATEGTIEQMEANIAARPYVWDQVYPGIPPTTETAETVPGRTAHPRGTRPPDHRRRTHRHRRDEHPARPGPRLGCSRGRDL